MRNGDNKRAHLLLDDLFNVVEPTPDQTRLIAKAAYAAGDVADSYYYMSYFYLMSGDLKMALNQLQLGLGPARTGSRYSVHASVRGSKKCAPRCPKTGKTRSLTTTAATDGIDRPRQTTAVSQRSTPVSFGHQTTICGEFIHAKCSDARGARCGIAP